MRCLTAKGCSACQLALLVALAAGGLSSTRAAPNYFARTWQVEQGLPQSKVTAVVQTRDSYLWVGTYNGLARFDGVRFTVFDDNNTPELRSSRITSLFEAADGTLWIGTESGDVSQYRDGRFASVPLRANWSDEKIYAIAADDTDEVWLLNQAGELARARDSKVLSPHSGDIAKVVWLRRSQDGVIWVNREGVASALKGGELTVEWSTNQYLQGFCASRDGGMWVASDGGIRKWKDGEWIADWGPAPWKSNMVANLLETSDGALAGGTSGDGLWMVFPGSTNTSVLHIQRTNGLPSDWVISLWEDRERNLWCGTGAGLVLIRPSNLETISPPDNWKSCPVLSVLPTRDGALWVGTEGAGLYRLLKGGWTNFYAAQGIHNPYVWSLATDGGGKIWAGTWGGGLYAQREDGFDFAPGFEGFGLPAPALTFVRDELWIGTPAGALRYQNGELERFNEIAGEPFGDVRVIALEGPGTLWFGTAGGGLIRLMNGEFRRFKKADGLSSDFIECFHFADNGAMWIGTFGSGLNRFKDGRFSAINREQGLPNGVIGHIQADGRGFFWMSSYGGILRASEKDLNRCADGEIDEVPFLTYGINDGMPTVECSEGMQSAGARTPDGRLWFATAKGLVAVDPASVTANSLPPPVRIEEIRVDDMKFAHGNAAGPLRIPPGRHRIEFQYTGLSFVAPEKVRFKCRLNNFETEWADAGGKRVATYSFIPPGEYSFEVTACNNDGVWNETGASIAFEVLPHFWQTLWFRFLTGLAIVAGAAGAVWFDTRRRIHRKMEKLERQHAIENERARIAKDIHDDLGSSLTRITMLSDPMRSSQDVASSGVQGLKQIHDTARDLTRAMDEIVWAVDPHHDTVDSMVTYLEQFALDFLRTANIRCRLDVPLEFPIEPLNAETRHNLFVAFKEALNNIIKHSSATEVHISFTRTPEAFCLVVADNGRGFPAISDTGPDPGDTPALRRGNGLLNMRRRLAALGGSCEIESTPGKGTKVVFTISSRLPAAGN